MEKNKFKIYVKVEVVVDTAGKTVPSAIIWENGHRFEIDKITDVRPAASRRGGGIGTRYTCMICGQKRYLYWENPRWFVENGSDV